MRFAGGARRPKACPPTHQPETPCRFDDWPRDVSPCHAAMIRHIEPACNFLSPSASRVARSRNASRACAGMAIDAVVSVPMFDAMRSARSTSCSARSTIGSRQAAPSRTIDRRRTDSLPPHRSSSTQHRSTPCAMFTSRSIGLQCRNVPRSHAKKPYLPDIAARTRDAAHRAVIVAPTWQWQTISWSCQSVSSKKRLASP